MSADAPVKKPRGFKIALLILLILLLLLAAGIYFLPHILPTDTVRSIARERIKEATGLDVDFRAMRFGWTHGVTLEGVTVDVPNAGEGARLASFDSVRAAWAWRPLLSGMVAVEKLEVDGFAVRLVRDENGNLNLPEPPPAGPLAAASVPSANRLRLAAAVPAPDEGGKAAPIAIEVRSVELRRGTLTFDDLAGGLEAEAGLETLEIEGGPLDGEFAFSGRVKPYPSSLDAPAAPFSGKARLVRDLAFDPDGTAEIVIDVDGLPLGELAGKLQLGEALGSGTAGGRISANYDAGSIHAVVDGFRLDGVRLGRDDAALAVPDTKIALSADLRRDDPRVVLSGFSLENSLMEVTGRGWVDGVAVREESGIPWGEFEFAGRADVGGAAAYLEDGLGVGGLPDIAGGAGFSGKAAMPRPRGADPELRPSVSVAFTDGRVVAANIVEGVSGEIELAGVTIESALALGGAAPEIGATLNFDAIPVRALLADVSDQPVAMNLTGLGALRTADGAAQAELRLNSAGFDVPETPWAAPLRIDTTETRLVFDLARDRLDIDAANLTVNKTIRAGVRSGVVTGIRAGDPNGRIDMEFSAMLDTVENAFRPLIPAEIGGLEGSVRAALRAILSGGVAEMGANVELDKAKAALALPDSRVGVEADLATVGLSASIGLAATDVIRLDALRIDNGGATVQFSDRTGLSFAGRFGNSTLQASAALDLAASRAVISELKASTNGMSAVIGHDGVQTAAVTSGVLAAQVNVTPENAVAIPLGATGEFAIPEADFGVDNLVFHREDASGQDTASEFGQFA
ncbi:MAG: AsmA family protein, partial [Planctomycetota bacterium]|nr:AsmA family protein [Planctomycetota bacterium]